MGLLYRKISNAVNDFHLFLSINLKVNEFCTSPQDDTLKSNIILGIHSTLFVTTLISPAIASEP